MKRRTLLATGGLSIAGLTGCLGDSTYRVREVAVEAASGSLALTVRVDRAKVTIEQPAALSFTLTNTTDESVRIRNLGVWPFGVLGVGESPTEVVSSLDPQLFSSAYAESDRVTVGPTNQSLSVAEEPVVEALSAGDETTETYTLPGENLRQAGTYYIVGFHGTPFLEYQDTDAWRAFEPTVEITIETLGWLSDW